MPKKKESEPQVLSSIILSVADQLGLKAESLSKRKPRTNALKTGSFVLDLILGGGLPAGLRINIFGKEGSGKSTLVYHTIKNTLQRGIPVIFFDYEGSTTSERLEALGLDPSLFDPPSPQEIQKAEDGQLREGKLWYFTNMASGEVAFRFAKRLMDSLPDVRDDSPKLLIVVDSLAAMLPEAIAENDQNATAAAAARMLSDGFRMVKSRLRTKGVTWLDTNQLRTNPRQVYGNPEYEPGGMASKHMSDIRIKMTQRSNPKGGGKEEVEESPFHEKEDKYLYTFVKIEKNKVFQPFQETWLRIWFEEDGHMGRGIDPVYDLFQYLEHTHQAVFERGYMKFSGPMAKVMDKNLRWKEFKRIVLSWLDFGESHPLIDEAMRQLIQGDAWRLFWGEDLEDTEEVEESFKEVEEEKDRKVYKISKIEEDKDAR